MTLLQSTSTEALFAAALVFTCAGWLMIRKALGTWRKRRAVDYAPPPCIAQGFPIARNPHRVSSFKDKRYVSVHEAGHTLLYAALGSLPAALDVVIFNTDQSTRWQGTVNATTHHPIIDDRPFYEWAMLVFLAGKEAELYVLDEHTLGSIQDHHDWLSYAHTYLANHCEGVFYLEPASTFEQQSNNMALNALQERQRRLLQNFLSLNAEVLKELAETLMDREHLHRADLYPFLARVMFPKGFPMPRGEFDCFCLDDPIEGTR